MPWAVAGDHQPVQLRLRRPVRVRHGGRRLACARHDLAATRRRRQAQLRRHRRVERPPQQRRLVSGHRRVLPWPCSSGRSKGPVADQRPEHAHHAGTVPDGNGPGQRGRRRRRTAPGRSRCSAGRPLAYGRRRAPGRGPSGAGRSGSPGRFAGDAVLPAAPIRGEQVVRDQLKPVERDRVGQRALVGVLREQEPGCGCDAVEKQSREYVIISERFPRARGYVHRRYHRELRIRGIRSRIARRGFPRLASGAPSPV